MVAIPPGFPNFASLPAGQQPLSLFDTAFQEVFNTIVELGGITVGTTAVNGGLAGHILYDAAGVLGELATSGAGDVVLSNGATLLSAVLNGATLQNAILLTGTLNGLTITPAVGITLTIAAGKTLAANASLTLAGADGKTLTLTNGLTVSGNDGTLAFGAAGKTAQFNNSMNFAAGADGQTWTFPAVSATVLTTGNTATISKGFTLAPNALGNMTNFTVDPTLGNYQYGTNHGAVTITAPASDCAVTILVTNDATAGAITFSGFTVAAGNTGDALTTTNTNKFLIMINRINGVSTYIIKALQ